MIILKPPFKGLNVADDPKLLGPEWAVQAFGFTLQNGVPTAEGTYEPFTGTLGNIFYIHDAGRTFSIPHPDNLDTVRSIVVLDTGFQVIILRSESPDSPIISTTISGFGVPTDVSNYRTFVNFQGNVYAFSTDDNNPALIFYQTVNWVVRVAQFDFDFPNSVIFTGSTAPDTGMFPNGAIVDYKVAWRDIDGNVGKTRLSGIPGAPFINYQNAGPIMEIQPIPANTDRINIQTDIANSIIVYRRERISGGGGESEWFLIPPSAYLSTNDPNQVGLEDLLLIYQLGGAWRFTDRVKSENRDFTTIAREIAPIENASSATKHVDQRIYLARKNVLSYTENGIANRLEDATPIGSDEPIVDVKSLFNQLIILKTDALFVMSGFPPNQVLIEVEGFHGGTSKMIRIGQRLLIPSQDGVFPFNGSQLGSDITKPLKRTIYTSFNESVSVTGRLKNINTAVNSEKENIYFTLATGKCLIYHYGENPGWTESLYSSSNRYNIKNLEGETLLLRVEGSGIFRLNPDVLPNLTIDTRWQTPFLHNGDTTKDKHWLNIEVDFGKTSKVRIAPVIRDKREFIIQFLPAFELTEFQREVRLGVRGRYLQLLFANLEGATIATIRLIKVKATTLQKRS